MIAMLKHSTSFLKPAFFNYINFIHGVSQSLIQEVEGEGEGSSGLFCGLKSQSQLSPSEQPLLKETMWKEEIGTTINAIKNVPQSTKCCGTV